MHLWAIDGHRNLRGEEHSLAPMPKPELEGFYAANSARELTSALK
jgi:hypothetical protein